MPNEDKEYEKKQARLNYGIMVCNVALGCLFISCLYYAFVA